MAGHTPETAATEADGQMTRRSLLSWLTGFGLFGSLGSRVFELSREQLVELRFDAMTELKLRRLHRFELATERLDRGVSFSSHDAARGIEARGAYEYRGIGHRFALLLSCQSPSSLAHPERVRRPRVPDERPVHWSNPKLDGLPEIGIVRDAIRVRIDEARPCESRRRPLPRARSVLMFPLIS